MNRPTPAPLPGGERAFTRVFRFPSWEGLGVGSWSQCTLEAEVALHEPSVWSPRFSRSGPPEGGTPYRSHAPDAFIVPMHGRNAEEAFQGILFSCRGVASRQDEEPVPCPRRNERSHGTREYLWPLA